MKTKLPESYVIHQATDVKPPLNPVAIEVLNAAMTGGKENFSGNEVTLSVMFLARLVDGKQSLDIVGFPIMDESNKDAIGIMLRNARAKYDCVAFITEAWMARLDVGGLTKEQAEAESLRIPVRDRPNRIEVMQICLFDLLRTVIVSSRIVRPKSGSAQLSEWEVIMDSGIDPSLQLGGRMSG